MTPPRFVVDAMLGRLARWLRAMGYDTLSPRPAEDPRLLELSLAEDRILLTRDGTLARLAGARGCLIRATTVDDQITEAVQKLALSGQDRDWLSRCLECNARLEPRPKGTLGGLVPDRILAIHAEFTGCPNCGRIYWSGSHAERITARLARLVGRDGNP